MLTHGSDSGHIGDGRTGMPAANRDFEQSDGL